MITTSMVHPGYTPRIPLKAAPERHRFDLLIMEVGMVKRQPFTVKMLDALPPALAGKRAYYGDIGMPGLQVAVTPRGTRTFVVRHKIEGQSRRMRLGDYPAMTIEQARKKARSLLNQIADGVNPITEKRADQARAVTLAEVFTDYCAARKNLKPKTVYDYGRALKVAFADWHPRPLLAITKDMIARRHTQLGKDHGETYANFAMRTLRALFNFAIANYEGPNGHSIILDNPVRRLSQTRAWYRAKRRDTVLRDSDLPAWFAAVRALADEDPDGPGAVVADYLHVLLLTGLRRSEAAALAWRDVDLSAKTLTVRDTKNGEDHTLPLSDFLYDLLARRRARDGDGVYVFPGPGKGGYLIEPRRGVGKVIAHSGVAFTLHDLRRTFATLADGLSLSHSTVKRLLNHKMDNDVTAGYIVPGLESLRVPMQHITDAFLTRGGVSPGGMVLPFVVAGVKAGAEVVQAF